MILALLLAITPGPGDPGTVIFKQGSTVLGRANQISCGTNATCSINQSTGVGTISCTSTPCATCDAGYGVQTDGGCGLLLPACNPNLGRYADAGCVMSCPASTPLEPCAAMDAGDWVGSGKWCLKGDQTMAAGSAVALYPVNAPPTQSWPVAPTSTLVTQTRLNDISGGPGSWNQFFTTDGGQPTPPGAFTTCTWASNMIRNVAAPTNLLNAFVRYGAAGAIKWADVSSSATFGDNVTCSPGCDSPSNHVDVPRRTMAMHCAVFTPGDGGTGSGNTQACTYIPGRGTSCSGTAHVQPKIGPVATGYWMVGLSTSGTGSAEMLDGWHWTSLMTEKAWTVADMDRIGGLTLLGAPSGETFTRLTDKTCCDSDNECVNLPPNVPCLHQCWAEASPLQVLNTDANPEDTMSLTAFNAPLDGGSAVPVATVEDHQGPFGFTTAIRYDFHQTEVYSSDAGNPYSWTESKATSCTLSILDQGILLCSWMVYGPGTTLDMCVNNSAPTTNDPLLPGSYGQQCSTCSPGAGWTYCSISALAKAAGTSCIIGNLTQTAPTNSQANNGTGLATGTHVVRGPQSAWITMDQCNPLSSAIDYSFLGNSTTRAVESCSGTGCP